MPRLLYPREWLGTHWPVWKKADNVAPTGIRFSDRPALSDYEQRYPGPQKKEEKVVKISRDEEENGKAI